MTREEAIKKVRWELLGLVIDKDVRDALETLIPELRESEDERIRKWLYDYIERVGRTWGKPGPFDYTQILAYLEKQKDASKAIEAVERIDKYIDEHLANAHDMKDSSPDKKYYRGWDDALGKMAGILQDVYSWEKQKEPEDVSASTMAPSCWAEEPSLQKESLHIQETCKENVYSFTDEDENIRQALILLVSNDKANGYTDFYTAQEITCDKVITFLKKLKQLPTNEEMLRTLRVEYEKGVADTIAKYEQKEQKPEIIGQLETQRGADGSSEE